MDKIRNIEIEMTNKMMDNLKDKELVGDIPNIIIEEVSNQIAGLVSMHFNEAVMGFNVKSARENNVLICYAIDEKENTIVDILFTLDKDKNGGMFVSNVICSIKKALA